MLVTDIPVTRPAPGIAVIHAPADFDVYTVPALREAHVSLLNEGINCQIFDLAAVEFLDSTGLGMLVGALKRCRSRGGTVVLDTPSEEAAIVLRKTGVGKVFHIVEPVAVGIEARP